MEGRPRKGRESPWTGAGGRAGAGRLLDDVSAVVRADVDFLPWDGKLLEDF